MEEKRLLIDVSKWNGKIDWQKVKPHIAGAILQCGYGDDIKSQDDPTFEYNYAECVRLGIPRGAYLFSYAKNPVNVYSEVEHIKRLCLHKDWQYPIFIDLEDEGVKGQECVMLKGVYKDALDKIQSAGLWTGIYTGEYYYKKYIDGAFLPYTNWIAGYGKKPTGIEYSIWQYTSQGHIDGIDGNVDMNECYIDFPFFIKMDKREEVHESGHGVEYYTVQKNDTLWDIGRKYNVPWQKIHEWNANIIPDPNLIFAGQKLVIYK